MNTHDKDSLFEEFSDKDFRDWVSIFDLTDDRLEIARSFGLGDATEPISEKEYQALKNHTKSLDYTDKSDKYRFRDINQGRGAELLKFAVANGYNLLYQRLHDLIIDDPERFGVAALHLMSVRDGVLYD